MTLIEDSVVAQLRPISISIFRARRGRSTSRCCNATAFHTPLPAIIIAKPLGKSLRCMSLPRDRWESSWGLKLPAFAS